MSELASLLPDRKEGIPTSGKEAPLLLELNSNARFQQYQKLDEFSEYVDRSLNDRQVADFELFQRLLTLSLTNERAMDAALTLAKNLPLSSVLTSWFNTIEIFLKASQIYEQKEKHCLEQALCWAEHLENEFEVSGNKCES